jgi:hypothetical protein
MRRDCVTIRAVRSRRRSLVGGQRRGTSSCPARLRPSTTASSIAWQAPCPRFGVIGCAASPRSVTRPRVQRARGSRSWMSLRRIARASVASITASMGGCHPRKSSSRSRWRSAVSGSPLGRVARDVPVDAIPAHRPPVRGGLRGPMSRRWRLGAAGGARTGPPRARRCSRRSAATSRRRGGRERRNGGRQRPTASSSAAWSRRGAPSPRGPRGGTGRRRRPGSPRGHHAPRASTTRFFRGRAAAPIAARA